MIHNTNNFLISLSVTSFSLSYSSFFTYNILQNSKSLKKKKGKNQIIWFDIIAQRTKSSASCSLYSLIFICRKCPPFSENMIDLCLWVTCRGLSASILFLLAELCLIASSGVTFVHFFSSSLKIESVIHCVCVCFPPPPFFCPHFFLWR